MAGAPWSTGLAIALTGGILLAGCQREPAHPKAGDVVRPLVGGATGTSERGHFSTVSIHEYSDVRRDIVTGKRIRFRIEQAYATAADRRQGPQTGITLLYRIDDLEPWPKGPQLRSPAGRASASIERDALGGDLTAETIATSPGPFGTIGMLPAGSLAPRGEVCGMRAYEVTEAGSLETVRPGHAFADPAWPSSGGLVLTVPGRGAAFSSVIGCSAINLVDGFPMCRAQSDYRGWPMQIVFSGRDLCRYTQILTGARTLFDRFYLDETDRSAGQVEHRWSPAARP